MLCCRCRYQGTWTKIKEGQLDSNSVSSILSPVKRLFWYWIFITSSGICCAIAVLLCAFLLGWLQSSSYFDGCSHRLQAGDLSGQEGCQCGLTGCRQGSGPSLDKLCAIPCCAHLPTPTTICAAMPDICPASPLQATAAGDQSLGARLAAAADGWRGIMASARR